ncbi:ATP-binding cassette domain-containing protein [Myxococcota bacterium]|nr:ATP-binding cassette domain-containing protein [Myxococcota bacterium]MBU1537981.1 ATP-binding cassette domain-containing protein [Myxococcota bacterium]
MALINIRNLTLGFGGHDLFDGISLQIESGERVALVGRNGSGKSTLMKCIAHQVEPDDGSVDYAKGIRVAMLPQEVPVSLTGSVLSIVSQGLGESGNLLNQYIDIEERLRSRGDPSLETRLHSLRAEMEEGESWQLFKDVEATISRMNLEPHARIEQLSGGQKRRVLLAKALACKPDLLMLDEPTNHLDIDTIIWLEDFLLRMVPTLLFVTHDRAFLKRMANRIAELDRGALHSFDHSYEMWLERKAHLLQTEREQNYRFDKKLAQEEGWLKQGVKARRTRNEGRVKSLMEMRNERQNRRNELSNVSFSLESGQRSAKVVIKAQNLGFTFPGAASPVVSGLTTNIIRGDKIGLIGPNGCGKTTLIRLLLGELPPDSGTVSQGHNLAPLYFDQLRATLDESKSVKDNIGDGKDMVEIGGKQRHIYGYLADFLFTPDRAKSPVSTLSGGEKNRLLLAKLFTQATNLLIMDEPTNDLDVETLELLEQLLMEYEGTLLLVSHDRAFLNNVVTSTLVFEGDRIGEYAGGYDDWLSQRTPPAQISSPVEPRVKAPKRAKPRKLTFREKQLLLELPDRITQCEEAISTEEAKLVDPDFYRKFASEVSSVMARIESLKVELDSLYLQWTELEEINSPSDS